MNSHNYRNFYQKALISIGIKDRALLTEITGISEKAPEFFTHWLIALEAECISLSEEYYHWKVSIYPSNSGGSFAWNHVLYSSDHLHSIDRAMELARIFELHSINDELHTANLHEKIS